MSKEEDKKFIENVILNGSRAERLALYQFDCSMSTKEIAKRFNCFVVGNFVRYYKSAPAPFHDEMIEHYIESYKGNENYLNIGFRGCAKTSLKKLFDAYVLLNDIEHRRKFLKVMTRDSNNSKQLVTDVYNLMVEVAWLYGDRFEKDGKKKREETMSAFTLKDGRRYASGTVGQTQRGQVTDDSRPDWIWFEDIEDSDSIRSIVKTQTTISKADEAIQGLSFDGNYLGTANYISDEGVVEWFKQKKDIVTQITPIVDENGTPTWPRITKEKVQKIKDDAEDWEGDYMCNPSSSKDKFFSIEAVKAQVKNIKDPINKVGFMDLWDEYKPHHMYAIGADTAEGIGEDSNASTLCDFTKDAFIGSFHSNTMAPDALGYEMANIGRMFGSCIAAPERNNTGHATLAALKESNYPNIYREIKVDELNDRQTEKLGWETTRKSKPKMWFDFRKDFNDGNITIYDIELLEEIRKYTNADFNNRTTGVITRHFDLLTAAVITWQMKEYVFIDTGEDDSVCF